MKAGGLILALIGLAVIACGVFFFVKIARRASEARVVKSLPLVAGTPVSAEVCVSVERKCQISMEIHPDLKAFGDPDISGILKDYPFSLSYQVADDTGTVIVAESLKSWQFTGTTNGFTGFVEFSYNSSKFDPPRSGKLNVEVRLTKESKSRRFLASEAKVYDTVSDHTIPSVYGIALGMGGGVLVLLGGGMLSLGFLKQPKRRPA